MLLCVLLTDGSLLLCNFQALAYFFQHIQIERAELDVWLSGFPEGARLVDTWEPPIPPPQDHDEQRAYYSGKQADHTRKHQLISLPNSPDIVDGIIGEKGLLVRFHHDWQSPVNISFTVTKYKLYFKAFCYSSQASVEIHLTVQANR